MHVMCHMRRRIHAVLEHLRQFARVPGMSVFVMSFFASVLGLF